MAPLPLVSIIIPCYRQATFLAEAIESALAQDYSKIEICVVDDGSPDDTSSVAARYPVTCIRQENRGLAGARNAGLQQAHGRFVLFLDADDRLLPNAVRSGVQALQSHPHWAFTFGTYRVIVANGVVYPMDSRPPVGADAYGWLLRYNWIGMHATVLYQRSILDAVGAFDEALRAAEDYDVYLRIARQHPIGAHPAQVAEYRRHSENMTSRASLMLDAVLNVLGRQWEFVEGSVSREAALQSGIRSIRHEYLSASVRAMGRALMLRPDRRPMKEWLPVIVRHGPPLLALSLARMAAGRLSRHRAAG